MATTGLNLVTQKLYEHVRRLLRRRAYPHVKKILAKTHSADISALFRYFDEESRVKLLGLCESDEKKAEVISNVDYEFLPHLFNSIEFDELLRILEKVDPDDLADILANIPDEMKNKILDGMKKEDQAEVEGLMHYKENTAGGIMSPDFLQMNEEMTAKEAIEILQKKQQDVEMAFYIYVVNEREQLVGVISLRQLVTCPPDTKLKELMNPNVVRVKTHDDQEHVAHAISRYDILAVPVVDEENKLVGIVTVDDVIDVIREEATEDMLKMAGAGEKMSDATSLTGSLKTRMPWLILTWFGLSLTALVIDHFKTTIHKIIPLAAFIPMISGMSGNVGTQSGAVVVRAIATGRYNMKQIWKVLGREVLVGFILGFTYGIVVGSFGFIKYMKTPYLNSLMLGLVISFALCAGMSFAALIATAMPFILHRFNLDPAAATGPLVTTICDWTSNAIYLSVATLILM